MLTRSRLSTLGLLVVALAIAHPVRTGAASDAAEPGLQQLIGPGIDAFSRPERVAIARAFGHELEAIQNALPVARNRSDDFIAGQLKWIAMIEDERMPEIEMSAWTGLAAGFMQTSDYDHISDVVKRGKIDLPPGDILDKIEAGGVALACARDLYAQKILEQIVAPNIAPEEVQQAYRELRVGKP